MHEYKIGEKTELFYLILSWSVSFANTRVTRILPHAEHFQNSKYSKTVCDLYEILDISTLIPCLLIASLNSIYENIHQKKAFVQE